MLKTFARITGLALTTAVLILPREAAHGYDNFEVAVYARAYEVREMADPAWLTPRWEEITRQVHVDKVYLETHRDLILVGADTVVAAKRFFEERGIRTAGGITLTVNERNRFETFCYSNPEHLEKVREGAYQGLQEHLKLLSGSESGGLWDCHLEFFQGSLEYRAVDYGVTAKIVNQPDEQYCLSHN